MSITEYDASSISHITLTYLLLPFISPLRCRCSPTRSSSPLSTSRVGSHQRGGDRRRRRLCPLRRRPPLSLPPVPAPPARTLPLGAAPGLPAAPRPSARQQAAARLSAPADVPPSVPEVQTDSRPRKLQFLLPQRVLLGRLGPPWHNRVAGESGEQDRRGAGARLICPQDVARGLRTTGCSVKIWVGKSAAADIMEIMRVGR